MEGQMIWAANTGPKYIYFIVSGYATLVASASAHGGVSESEASRAFGMKLSPYMLFGPDNYMVYYFCNRFCFF